MTDLHIEREKAIVMERRAKVEIHDGGGRSRSGLFCHYLYGDSSAQYVLLDLEDEEGSCAVVNPSLSFFTRTNAHICASSNGLILFSCFGDNVVNYSVFNLFTKQSMSLPQPQINRRSVRTGLAFGGKHYHVVRVFTVDVTLGEQAGSSSAAPNYAETSGLLEMEIYSSTTGVWRHRRPLIPIHLPPELPRLDTTPLYSNGAIHWELGGHLLVYCVDYDQEHEHAQKQGCFNLIQLPNYSDKFSWQSTMTYGQSLWESEGRVNFCYSDFEGIHTWVLLKEEDHNYYSQFYKYDHHIFKWKLVHTVTHQSLVCRNPVMFIGIGQAMTNNNLSQWEASWVAPLAYFDKTQTMYLRLPGAVVSYNLSNQSLKEICKFVFPGTNFYCCSFFPVAFDNTYSGQRRDSQMLGAASGTGGGILSLPIPMGPQTSNQT